MINPSNSNAELIGANELWQLIQKSKSGITILDVRTAAAYQNGHIPGAVHCGFYGTEPVPPRVQAKAVVVAYSEDDAGAEMAAALQRHFAGHTFLVLDGGWLAWIREGLPISPPVNSLLSPWQMVDGMDWRLVSRPTRMPKGKSK